MTNIYVLYHAHCTDGTGSKFAAWKKFGTAAKYIAVAYGKPMPEMEPNSEVYIIDFSYPRDILEALHATHKSVVVLDHHKTAEEDLRGLPYCHFDMHRSGCVMAWNYFHPNIEVPALLQDIQDRDLWLFKRPNSKAIHAGLQLLEGSMADWDRATKGVAHYQKLVDDGNLLLKRQNAAVKSAVNHKTGVISLFGCKCGIINSNDLSSEIGNGICASTVLNVDFALIYCITQYNEVLISLRSIGDFDVSAIAQKFGGGGHKNSSGANTTIDVLWKILKGNYDDKSEPSVS